MSGGAHTFAPHAAVALQRFFGTFLSQDPRRFGSRGARLAMWSGKDRCIHGGSDLRGTGCLCTVAHDTGHIAQRVHDGPLDHVKVRVVQVGNGCTGTHCRRNCTAR